MQGYVLQNVKTNGMLLSDKQSTEVLVKAFTECTAILW